MRPLVTLLLGAALAVLMAAPAAAGGWATTELDTPEPALTAGEPTEIGFTVLQHGVTPAAVHGAGLHLISDSGEEVFFSAKASGPTGHYVAVVVPPAGGSWEIVAQQGELLEGGKPSGLDFGTYPLATIDVTGAVVQASHPEPAPASEGVSPMLAAAAALIIAIVVGLTWWRGRHRSGDRVEYVGAEETA